MTGEPERFYVRHCDPIMANEKVGWRPLPAVTYIRDRWYGHRDVARIMREPARPGGYVGESVAMMRRRAEALCDQWNREHKAAIR
jgi:hypothetical protein